MSKKPKILVADDSPEIRQFFQDFLPAKGYEILLAVDGEDAVKKAKSKKPDLIILDVNMPKMDGFKALEIIKQDHKGMTIPVIMLTDRQSPADISRGIQGFADKYLPKPFQLETIVKEIEQSLSLRPPQ